MEYFSLYHQARLQYQELIDLQTENAQKYKIAIVFIDLDYLEDFEEGLTLAEEVVVEWDGFTSSETEFQGEALDGLGWAYYKQGQKDEALKRLNQALELFSYSASIHYHKGVINAEIGNEVDAQVSLERAIDLDLVGKISPLAANELEKLSHSESDN